MANQDPAKSAYSKFYSGPVCPKVVTLQKGQKS